MSPNFRGIKENFVTTVKTISVVIPNFNHGKLVEKSIRSTFEQSSPPDEVIVIDDGSTDDSVKRLKKLAKEIPNLKLFLCKENRGALVAGMIGVKESKGDILFFRAADDILPYESIKLGREAFQKYPESQIAFGEILFFRDKITNGTVESLALSNETSFFSPTSLIELWKPDFNLPEPACFVKKSALLEQGGLLKEAKWYSGWLCFTSIALKHGITFIPEVLNTFRLDANSYGTTNLRNKVIQRKVLRFLINHVMNLEKDLKDKFIDSGAFSIFGEPLKNLLDEEKLTLPKNSNLLINNALPREYLGSGLPQYGIAGVIVRRLRELRQKIDFIKRINDPKIAIYGAGTQTLIILEIWKRLRLPKLSLVTVSETNAVNTFHNLSIVGINSLEEREIDLFILSSKSFELEMASKLDDLYPSTNRISFWVKELTCITEQP